MNFYEKWLYRKNAYNVQIICDKKNKKNYIENVMKIIYDILGKKSWGTSAFRKMGNIYYKFSTIIHTYISRDQFEWNFVK